MPENVNETVSAGATTTPALSEAARRVFCGPEAALPDFLQVFRGVEPLVGHEVDVLYLVFVLQGVEHHAEGAQLRDVAREYPRVNGEAGLIYGKGHRDDGLGVASLLGFTPHPENESLISLQLVLKFRVKLPAFKPDVNFLIGKALFLLFTYALSGVADNLPRSVIVGSLEVAVGAVKEGHLNLASGVGEMTLYCVRNHPVTEVMREVQGVVVAVEVNPLPRAVQELRPAFPGVKVGAGVNDLKRAQVEKKIIYFPAGDFSVLPLQPADPASQSQFSRPYGQQCQVTVAQRCKLIE